MSSFIKSRLLVILTALVAATPLWCADTKPELPVAVRTVTPVYPFEMRREGLMGVVKVSCIIDERGNVADVAVESTTNTGFNEAAITALKKWKFKPATVDGAPVVKRIVIPLTFALQES